MSKYYIVDSTKRQEKRDPVLIFQNISSVVKYLEGMCQRQFGKTRAQYMNDAESIGHSADETTGRAFYDQMEQYFNVGVIRGDSSPVKTNIFEAAAFLRNKDVHGN